MNIKPFLILFILFLSISMVSANEMNDINVTSTSVESPLEITDSIEDVNVTSISVESPLEITDSIDDIGDSNLDESNRLQVSSQDSMKSSDEDVIVVNDWDELQYYCAQTDKDYTLKLKENTNFYPTNPNNGAISQIKVKNNVKIIGSEGSYIGDVSPDARRIEFVAFLVEDNSLYGSLNFENVTFKYIYSVYSNALVSGTRDGIFIQMGGIRNNIFKNCIFHDILSQYGHATIVYLKKGTAILDNCSFINCTSGYGAVSVYDPNSVKSTNMVVRNCYFENNYASTEPGCINNCGKLTVYNTTFVKNRSFWWAGAIHTHAGGNTTIYDSNFTDNVAGWNGGALYTYAYLQIYNSVFVGNNCTTDNGGGAIGACSYQSDPHIYIEKCLFKDNSNNCWYPDSLSDGYGRGGAISLMDAGSIEVRDTTFVANSAYRGTAICAFDVKSYGSPDIIIVNNSFINHTRVGDVLEVRVDGTILNVSDNYYYGNSVVFSNLTLIKLREDKEFATLQVNVSLSKPQYYDSDILDKTWYDVYVNNKYVKTVNTTTFSIDFDDLDICDVYVIPTISNRKSNEVTIVSTREYVFVSKNNGNDSNNGISRDTPVNTIKRALELARNCQNVILLDGDYSEENLQINYDVTIKGEGNATLTGDTSFVSNYNFTLKNLKINNLNADTFIKENSNSLVISNCIITNNAVLLVQNNGFAIITNSILLNNSNIVQGNNVDLDYNWWGNSVPDLNINKYVSLNLTSDVSALENNQKANVKAVFYLNDGIKYLKLPEISFDVSAINGTVNQNSTIADANVVYTLTGFDDGVFTVYYNDFTVSKTFEFLKSTPSMSLTAEDIMVGDNLTVTVTLPSDVEGNLTVNVGNISQSKVIESSNTIFTFSNLKADSYTVSASYSGDKKYMSKTTTAGVNVNKYESATNLNISTINVGEDVILTITTTDSSTGSITLSINNKIETLALTNSKADYTIKNIKRGDYLITAVYNGDDKYLSSQDSKFIEVDNLNATMNINAEDITYGDTAVIKVTLNSDATGEVIVTIDGITNSSNVVNGKAEVSFTNVEAGFNKNISVFYSGDDTYFNLTNSSTFNIAKADLTFTMESKDIKIGQSAEIVIKVPAKTSGTFTINGDVMNIPLSGEITYGIADLEIGNYTCTATYNGNNYNTVSNTTSFEVSEYPTPQWATEGENNQNTHKSPYETTTNGEIAFTIPFNQTLSGELAIDSEGNIYLTTPEGIHCFNQTNQLWYFTSTDAMGNLSGIAIGRDVVIAPKSGDTLYFINQTTGERYGSSNIYQGSSFFAPVIDSNATLYVVSEYQFSSEDYKLTIIPYKLWENGGDPTLVTIGNTQPLCSPTLNENIIVVISDNRLRMIDAKTLQTISIKGGNYQPIRPVIGEGNIVYAVLSDSIVAYNANGVQVWKTKVTGKVGSTLAIDPEQGVYHVNSKKILYKYDIVDGKEYKVSNLKVTSGLLIGSDGTLYFGSNSMFYAMDSEGNVLWKSDLGHNIIGNPVMDKNGLIYTVTEEGIVALTYAPLKDPNIIINVSDVHIGEDAVVNIGIDSQILGDFSIVFNGETYKNTYTKVFSNLEADKYSVDVVFDGDTRFMAKTVTVNFTVSKYDSNLTVSTDNVLVGESLIFDISLVNDATGNITLNLNNQNYTAKDNKIIIDNLPANTYNYNLVYSGDAKYESKTLIGSVTVSKTESNLTVSTNNIFVDESLVFDISLASDATGTVILNLNNQNYTAKDNKIIIDNLPANTYNYSLIYSGDAKYESKTVVGSVSVSKIETNLTASAEDINVGDDAVVNIKMLGNAVGNVTATINGKNYSAAVNNGVSKIIISDLKAGNYTISVYFTSYKYVDCVNDTAFTVSKVKLTDDVLNVNDTVFTINLPSDAAGALTVNVNSKNYTQSIIDGKAIVGISDLNPGTYTAHVSYSGDDKYESISFNDAILNIDKLPSSISVSAADINIGDMAIVNITTSTVSGKVTVTVNNKDYNVTVTNYLGQLIIPDLAEGSYNVVAKYLGDDTCAVSINTTAFSVLKVEVPIDNETITIPDSADTTSYSINLPEDATGNLTVSVDGVPYTAALVKGKATVNIPELESGSHNITVTYSGDDKYSPVSKSKTVNVKKAEKLAADLSVTVADIEVGKDAVINIKITDDATGQVVVTVNNKNYTASISNGSTKVSVSGLGVGKYDVFVKYPGDEKFNETSKSASFSVLKVNLPVTDEIVTIPEGDSSDYSISLPSDATGTLTVTVDGKQYSEKLVNGKATVSVPELGEGSHNITVVYSGDSKYSPIVKSKVIVKPHVPVIKLTGSNLNMLYSSGKYYKVKLTSDGTPLAGKDVSIIINGKAYTKTTDNKGFASIKITLAPKTYTVNVTYGDVSTSNKVVVKNIISAKNVNAKKSAKTVKIKVTLKKVNGKYLKNKKVTLKFNKKTIKAKTNKKGVVTFTIKKNVYKKLKTNKKYTYQVIYGKDKVKKSIKFKK